MVMPGRKYAGAGGYRYGFNGKENDNEVKGEGNQQDYGMRIYDPRVGKFLSVDPITKEYPELTPYQFASNTPIQAIDLDGLEAVYRNVRTGETASGPLYPQNFPASEGWKCEVCPIPAKPVLTIPQFNNVIMANPREMEILKADIFGVGHIGPKSVVEGNIAAVRQNYNNAVGDNIRGGFFGAVGYLATGDKGSFYGATLDNIALSFAGIPGESSVLSKPSNLPRLNTTNSTEIAPYEHAPLHLTINLKQGWNKEQVTEAFDKGQAITNNPNAKVTLKNPEPRPSNLRKDYLKQGGTLTKGQQLDHITDLQINGTNNTSNLRLVSCP